MDNPLLRRSLFPAFIGCFILFFASMAQANQTLDNFYQATRSLQANFTQSVRTVRGKVIEQSSGKLILNRPDQFILQYIEPAEQKYISNGRTIWVYDVELEQVSIKNIDEGIGDSPALLLSSNNNIYKHYDVSDLKNTNTNGLAWVELRSKQEDMTFEKVILGFDGKVLKQMIMHDNFGQITELTFFDMEINRPYSIRQFNFVPPDGVDIMGSDNAR